jgi:TolB protein
MRLGGWSTTFVWVVVVLTGGRPAESRDIVYTSSSEHQPEQIWRMRPDGSNPHPATPAVDGAHDSFAVWSPDGRSIAFMSDRLHPGRNAIFIMNADGSDVRQVGPDSIAFQAAPDFSPDGHEMVFSGGGAVLQSALYVMNSDGSGAHRLTHSNELERCPRWSPDGTRILFLGGNEHLRVLEVASGQVSSILPDGMDGYCGDWSPDGAEVAFSSGPHGHLPSLLEVLRLMQSEAPGGIGQEIYVLELGTMKVKHLPQAGPVSLYPRWSRDGRRLVFHAILPPGSVLGPNFRDDPRVSEIYTIAPDGSDLRRLTNNAVVDVHPNW